MYDIIRENKRHEKDVRIQQLKKLLEDSTSDEDGTSSSSSECKENTIYSPIQNDKREPNKNVNSSKKKKKERNLDCCGGSKVS
uniref:Uncharacterized protein n=1 Tax=Monodelphis domestica TaxID=13616 RepID=A0A5F8G1Z7_MONDO